MCVYTTMPGPFCRRGRVTHRRQLCAAITRVVCPARTFAGFGFGTQDRLMQNSVGALRRRARCVVRCDVR